MNITDYQNRFDRKVIRDIFHQTDDVFYFTVQDDELESKHTNFMIFHYPIMFWRRGYIHLHGHIHSGPYSTANEKVPFHPMRWDIGVDAWNYAPVSYNILRKHINKMSEKL